MKRRPTKPYQLWHLRLDVPGNAVLLFMDYDYLRSVGQRVELNRYRRVYTGETGRQTTLDTIYNRFNCPRTMPQDYLARSLSVSDLVVMDGAVWYVDSFGFRDVTKEVSQMGAED